MTPEEYRALALKTEHTPCFVRTQHGRVTGDLNFESKHDIMLSRMVHAILGMVNELGELAGALKAHIIYGKPIDEINLIEELGDTDWYRNLFGDAMNVGFEVAWTKNIAKLKARFGDKFTSEKALNRDKAAERAALEGIETPLTANDHDAVVLTVIVDDRSYGLPLHRNTTLGAAMGIFQDRFTIDINNNLIHSLSGSELTHGVRLYQAAQVLGDGKRVTVVFSKPPTRGG